MQKPPLIMISVGILALVGIVMLGRSGSEKNQRSSSTAVGGIEAGQSANLGGAAQRDAPARQIPSLELATLSGETVNLNQFVGQKAVVIDFWATWCPNCQRDMPKMQQLYETYKDHVEILAINLQESQSDIERFVAARKLTYPILLDPSGKASQLFGISYTNTHILISKSGKILGVLPGDMSEDEFKQLTTAS